LKSLVVSGKSYNFAVMKLQKYILIEIIMMAVATGGLILLTGDYIMSLGIVILLVVVEHLLVSYLERRKEDKKDAEDEAAD
jgi:hypothetical protein